MLYNFLVRTQVVRQGIKSKGVFLGIFQKRLDKNHEMVYNIKAD
jgi:hypothetical protein